MMTNTSKNIETIDTKKEIAWQNRNGCGEISAKVVGESVTLYGWVDAIRDHGHLLFLHLRDRSGFVQVVFDSTVSGELFGTAERLRPEWVVEITGIVRKRSDENINPNVPNGDIEVEAGSLRILSQSKTPPFIISEKESLANEGAEAKYVDEDIRLKYRYLDLRKRSMQDHLIKRSEITQTMRTYLTERGFLDVETPVLTKSTPEGARDYLVPSRTQPGHFYALPQSPQLFKQLLMVSGLEKYYQIVKCFRDEDLRPNRQPEFTQLDLEASFIDESYIYELIEGLIKTLYKVVGTELQTPLPRLTYEEAMNRYGSENPDLRFDLELIDVTEIVKDCDYKIFQTIVSKGGLIKGFALKGQSHALSKNMIQNELAGKVIQKLGGKGLTWMRVENGTCESNVVQFFSEEALSNLQNTLGATDGDIIFMVADTDHQTVNEVLGRFRVYIAEKQGLIDPNKVSACWITEFPMFELKDGALNSMHHPFTQPAGPLPDKTDKEALLKLKARAYDLVINGQEIGGGSIRIHDSHLQQQVFDLLGLSEREIDEKFGFFVQALQYGTPPHGGLALGLDRLMSILLKTDSIREVIAFPKNRMAVCPLTQAPSSVSQSQLSELNLVSTIEGID